MCIQVPAALGFTRAMTRDMEQQTSSGRCQRSSSFTGAPKVPERVKSQLGSAGANPQRGWKFKVLQSCLETSPEMLTEFINF